MLPKYLAPNKQVKLSGLKCGDRVEFKDGSWSATLTKNGCVNTAPAVKEAKRGCIIATDCILPTIDWGHPNVQPNTCIVACDDGTFICSRPEYLRGLQTNSIKPLGESGEVCYTGIWVASDGIYSFLPPVLEMGLIA